MKLGHEQAKELGCIMARFQQGELNIQEAALLLRAQFDRAMVIAMKEGARRAAEKLSSACYEGTVVLSEAKQAILSTAEAWTEKDL